MLDPKQLRKNQKNQLISETQLFWYRGLREQSENIERLYEEMNAYAKLAEKEGYRMIGTWQ